MKVDKTIYEDIAMDYYFHNDPLLNRNKEQICELSADKKQELLFSTISIRNKTTKLRFAKTFIKNVAIMFNSKKIALEKTLPFLTMIDLTNISADIYPDEMFSIINDINTGDSKMAGSLPYIIGKNILFDMLGTSLSDLINTNDLGDAIFSNFKPLSSNIGNIEESTLFLPNNDADPLFPIKKQKSPERRTSTTSVISLKSNNSISSIRSKQKFITQQTRIESRRQSLDSYRFSLSPQNNENIEIISSPQHNFENISSPQHNFENVSSPPRNFEDNFENVSSPQNNFDDISSPQHNFNMDELFDENNNNQNIKDVNKNEPIFIDNFIDSDNFINTPSTSNVETIYIPENDTKNIETINEKTTTLFNFEQDKNNDETNKIQFTGTSTEPLMVSSAYNNIKIVTPLPQIKKKKIKKLGGIMM